MKAYMKAPAAAEIMAFSSYIHQFRQKNLKKKSTLVSRCVFK